MTASLNRYVLSLIVLLTTPYFVAADDETEQGDRPARKPRIERRIVVDRPLDHWIGVMGDPADATVKSHLQIDAGVVLRHVMPGSPAEKAGLRANDILLKFGETPTGDVLSLSKAVAEAGATETKVEFLRDGERRTVVVTPEKRAVPRIPRGLPRDGQWDKVTEWLKGLEDGNLSEEALRMFMIRPGMVFPKEFPLELSRPGTSVADRLPNGTAVTIEKSDEGKVTVTVRRGDQRWDVSLDTIENLPEDLREPLRALLARRPVAAVIDTDGFRLELQTSDDQEASGSNRQEPDEAEAKDPSANPGVQQLLQELEKIQDSQRDREAALKKQLEELRQQFETLKSRTR